MYILAVPPYTQQAELAGVQSKHNDINQQVNFLHFTFTSHSSKTINKDNSTTKDRTQAKKNP